MKTDFYTKFILSVIAICLTILTLNNIDLIPKAYASKTKSLELSPTKKYGLIPINADGSITVKLSSTSEMDVNITGVNTRDKLNVNIDEVGGGYVSYGGPIDVKVR